jgi:mannosyltransferase
MAQGRGRAPEDLGGLKALKPGDRNGGMVQVDAMKPATDRVPALMLGFIMLVGFAIRSWNIQAQPLWTDEGLTLLVAQWPIRDLLLSSNDPTPAAYYLLHKWLVGTSTDLLAIRAISLAAGSALIGGAYLLAREARVPALTVARLTALSFPLIDYSQEARAYSLLVLLSTLCAWALLRWQRTVRLKWLLLFGGLALACFYTHVISVFWIAPLCLIAGIKAWRELHLRRHLVLASALGLILAGPELIRLANYPPDAFSWLRQPDLLLAINTFHYVFLPFGLFENSHWQMGGQLTALAGACILSLLAWRAWVHRRGLRDWAESNPAALLVISLSLAFPAVLMIFGYFVKPLFMPRTLLIAVPGFFAAVALILSFEKRIATLAAVGLYIVSLLLTGTVRTKEDWRTAAFQLSQNVRPGDVILLCPGWKAPAFRHAFKGEVGAPLLVTWGNRPMLLEPQLGANDDWIDSYFEGFNVRRRLGEGSRILGKASRVWHVNSECRAY